MGREKVLKKMRSNSIFIVVLGVLLFLGCAFLAFCCVLAEAIPMAIFLVIFALLGLFFIILGIRNGNPKTSLFTKRNPDLLAQADELYSNVVYEDKTIIHSHKTIASKKNVLNMAAFDEVIGIYEKKTTYNHLVTIEHSLVLVTPKGETYISIYGKNKEAVGAILTRIHQYCPNARLGFSPENLQYFKQVQKEYKKQRKANK